jgi:hypothetical protein
MDEFVGLIVEQLAKRAREVAAQKAAAASKAAPQTATQRAAAAVVSANAAAVARARASAAAVRPPPGYVPKLAPAPVRVAAVAPVSAAPAPPQAVAAAVPAAFSGVDLENPFGSLLVGGDAAVSAAVVAPDALLGAFTGGGPFLAAFILAEALAPPLALREPRSV